jgi:O-antigen ligase
LFLQQLPTFFKKHYSGHLAFLACIVLIIGLFFSRALMSIGMIGLFLSALVHENLIENFKSFWKQKSLWMFVGYFALMAISFFWSDDKTYFSNRLQIMLPFLVLPFAFFSITHWEKSWYYTLMLLFIIALSCGVCWSLFQYLSNKELFDIGYSYSKVIPTPFKNDHIRFSLAVVASICFAVKLMQVYTTKIVRITLACIILVSIGYLHILSAKSGIIAFYAVAIIFFIKTIFNTSFKKYGFIGLGLIIILPIIMFSISESFRRKISYIKYSYSEMKNDKLQMNVSDEGRMISYNYAFDIIKKNRFYGVGLGDVYHEMDIRLKRDIPYFEGDAILPHNQFLMMGTAVGILGILYLFILQLQLLLQSKKRGFLYTCIWLILFIGMMIEPFYETQYGACLYLFLLLLVWKQAEYAT